MPYYKRTIINSDGVVVRERCKQKRRHKQREIDYHREAMPKSRSTSNRSLASLGIYTGARIMKAGSKMPKQYTREIELNYSSPVDRRANPQLAHLKR